MLIISSLTVTTAYEIKSSSFSGDINVLYVGGSGAGNYTTIQDAVNAANRGDTIFVYDDSSPYVENLVIQTPINLVGENKDTTIIDGNGDNGIVIAVNNTTISNFKIINCYSSSGILIGDPSSMVFFVPGYVYNNSVDNIVFENNNINLFIVGNNHIVQNIICNDVGIYDVFLLNSYNTTFKNNQLTEPGINIYYMGFGLDFADYVDFFYHDIDTSNTVNGQPIYYYKDTNNLTVPSDAGEILAINCSNITVDKMANPLFIEMALVNNSTISNNTCNLFLGAANNNEIVSNQIVEANNYHYPFEGLFSGVVIGQTSKNNDIKYNTFTCPNVSMMLNGSNNDISWNNFEGPDGLVGLLGQVCSNNYITNNTFTNKSKYGIALSISEEDEIYDNIITFNSECGICFESANGNIVTTMLMQLIRVIIIGILQKLVEQILSADLI